MGVRISNNEHVTLYDSVTGLAFGPVFDSNDNAGDFLNFLQESYDEERKFNLNKEWVRYHYDPRVYNHIELEVVFGIWQNLRESGAR